MAQEIERKFLIEDTPPWLPDHPAMQLRQGYLVITDDVEVRVRGVEDQRVLTIKRGRGEVRTEVEVTIDAEQFEALWPLSESLQVHKRRYLVPLGGAQGTAEVDVFEGDLEGLVVVEVEFSSEDEAARFEPPAWFGRELTGDQRYATASLAENGLPKGE